ncbi:hypothetical protein [Roseovarius sp. EL26]|uniref:hypothetical protein n=1 Tax=Roseovarius sp. EL26 TaxID=2126672 RepID=UPI0013C486C4|nr:hypothetical protein [Roseovarius sp. EL26]
MTLQSIHAMQILSNAKWAFTTRRANKKDAVYLNKDYKIAIAGDMALCKIWNWVST